MGMFRGGASKLMNNIIDTVSTYAKAELDFDYITPKLAGILFNSFTLGLINKIK